MKHNLNFIYNNWLVITITLSVVIIFFSFFSVTTPSAMHNTDKYLHTAAYLFLSFSASLRKPTNYILIFIYFVFFGIVIELIQPYFNRYFELLDILANSLGVFLAITFADLLRKYYSY
jgi:nitrate/nitrite transporter NarK